ncbi:MAG: pyrimidine/purine nucleoside phosphorylase [Deltaproteobacteria bacterium]|nr:pyrimidine/purine nucleoside phosphorylase [Deltaproteobacteria bacterium]
MLKSNQYFDGNVKSIGFVSADGPATAGVMAKGSYEFGTSTIEIMVVTSGLLKVKLPGRDDWQEFKPFDRFEVAANQKFQLEVPVDSSYLCYYK